MLLLSTFGYATSTELKKEAFNSCLSFWSENAIESCENYIGYGGTDIKAFKRLGKLYQESKQFDKAEKVYRIALKHHQTDSSLQTKLHRSVTNNQEQLWMEQNSVSESVSARSDRLLCVRMAKIKAEQARDACARYLASNPGDQEAIAAQDIALAKLGLGKTKTNDSITLVAASQAEAAEADIQVRDISGETKKNDNNDNKVAEPKVQPEAPTQVASVTSQAVSGNSSQVDSETIEEIRADLAKIYSVIQEQQANPTKVAKAPTQLQTYKEAGARRALVIGVSNYPSTLGSLKNPANDAKDIAKTLEDLGFIVTLSVNGSLRNLEEDVVSFSRSLGPEDTAMFYYAGHGVQIQGENYLIPSGVEIEDEVDIKYKSINLSYILDKIEGRGKGVNLVVLDACRDNPFAQTRGVTQQGWATINGPVGTLIAYATAPGQVASDGAGDNGVYTKYLIREMTKPNVKVEDVFKNVRISVDQETSGQQIPWENSSLIGDFYFSVSAEG